MHGTTALMLIEVEEVLATAMLAVDVPMIRVPRITAILLLNII